MAYRAVARLEPLGDSPGLARALAKLSGHQVITGRYAPVHRHVPARHRPGGALRPRGGRRLRPRQPRVRPRFQAATIDEGITALREAVRPGQAGRAARGGDAGERQPRLARTWTEPQPALALEVLDEGLAVAEEHELHFQLNLAARQPGRGAGDARRLGRRIRGARRRPPRPVGVTAEPGDRAQHARPHPRPSRGPERRSRTLDELLAAVLPFDEAQLIVPVYLARAEAAWLNGDGPAAAADVEACLAYRVLALTPAIVRDLYLYARRTGVDWAPDDQSDEVTGYIASGDHGARARYWADRQCPYEAADALADSDDPDDVRHALEQLTALGARPRANQADPPAARARRARRAAGAPGQHPGQPGWAHQPRARGGHPARPRPHQRGDRRPADRLAEDHRPPRVVGPHQAGRVHPPARRRAPPPPAASTSTRWNPPPAPSPPVGWTGDPRYGHRHAIRDRCGTATDAVGRGRRHGCSSPRSSASTGPGGSTTSSRCTARGPGEAFDGVTTLAALAGQTSRIRLGPARHRRHLPAPVGVRVADGHRRPRVARPARAVARRGVVRQGAHRARHPVPAAPGSASTCSRTPSRSARAS